MAEREAKLSNAERRAWEQFRPKLEALTSLAEAMLLLKSAPPVGSPGLRITLTSAPFYTTSTPSLPTQVTTRRLST